MKLTTLSYSRTFRLGDYENERIEVNAELSEDDKDDPRNYIDELQQVVAQSSLQYKSDLQLLEASTNGLTTE
jgi:hypothetical protein